MARRRDRKEDMLGAGVYTPAPQPPFQGLAPWLVYITFQIDPDAVRPFVPAQLQLAASANAMLAVFESGVSWGLGLHSRALIGVEVEEHDSPDTNKAMFLVANVVGGEAWELIDRNYGRADRGNARVQREADAVLASAEINGDVWFDIALRLAGPLMPNNSGIDRYIGETDGGLIQHDVAYAATAIECEVERLQFGAKAPPAVLACRPVVTHFAGVNPDFAGAYSVPWPLTTSADNQTIGSYLDLLQADGRAAAVLSSDGKLIRANPKAMALMQQVTPSAMNAALDSATRSGRPAQLMRTLGPPLLARSTPFRLPGTIDDLILVFLIDLADPDRRAAAPFLQLLGLTAAEASIAELVGSGLSARDAALALELSDHTVRSTLKSIYDKLGIAKQSELARLLARLQF